jgi:phosphatidylinositol phospholipase C, delta
MNASVEEDKEEYI